MADLIKKRWFQVAGVVVLLFGFMVVRGYWRRGADTNEKNIVADICGMTITPLEYQAAITRRTTQIYNKEKVLRASDKEKIHIEAFRILQNNKMLDKWARELGVTVKESDIDQKIQKIKSGMDQTRLESQFAVYLAYYGYRNEQDLREDIRYEFLERNIAEKLHPMASYKVERSEVEAYIPSIELSQIFFNASGWATPNQDVNNSIKAITDRADEAYNKALTGEDFNKLAVEFSNDKNVGITKGALGWVSKSMVIPEFWAVAASLRPGEVSKPFKTPFGIHILKCTGIRTPYEKGYLDSEKFLRGMAAFQKQKFDFAEEFAKRLADMQQKGCYKVYDHVLLANKYRVQESFKAAIEEYKAAIKDEPENPYYYMDIAELLGRMEQKNEALTWFRRALEIAPMDGALYFRLGEVYVSYGEPAKAMREFSRASDLSRLDPEMHQRLQVIYSRMGYLQEAYEEHNRQMRAVELRAGSAGGAIGAPGMAPDTGAAPGGTGTEVMPDFGAPTPGETTPAPPLRPPGSGNQ